MIHYNIMLFSILFYSMLLYYILSYYIMLYYIMLYYVILHYITLYYIILYYVILYDISGVPPTPSRWATTQLPLALRPPAPVWAPTPSGPEGSRRGAPII